MLPQYALPGENTTTLGCLKLLIVFFQEPECEAEGGSCVDKCTCSDDNMLHSFCPSQPDSVKCCKTGEMTNEEACQAETTISQCLEENKRKKRSTDCSSKEDIIIPL